MHSAFISTPHIAGYSTDGKANGTAMSVNSVSRFFGLPLTGWYPDNVPAPANPVLAIDATGKTNEEIAMIAIKHTYDIESDSMNLRSVPGNFEKLRGDYPLRREFGAFTIAIRNDKENASYMLSNLGFQVNNS
jgi:erythronate-4-phosphate dehydrogenase